MITRVDKHRIAFVVNHAAFFVSHRLPLALAARKLGYCVRLITGKAGSTTMEPMAKNTLLKEGIEHEVLGFESDGINPLVEFIGFVQLIFTFLREKPAIAHCVTPKGILYGGIAARLCGVNGLVIAISGMGFLFTREDKISLKKLFASYIYRLLIRISFSHKNLCVIVQNTSDFESVVRSHIVKEDQVVLIPGSGVNLEKFSNISMREKTPLVILPARMIAEKGIYEFVEAARFIKPFHPDWRFVLVGAADYKSPNSIKREKLEEWQNEGVIEWVNFQHDMTDLFRASSIVCLPSYYREGLPKALLEGAAASCAIITTNTDGCREAIVPGKTGELVSPKNSKILTEVLMGLIENRPRRESYGEAGHNLALEKFDILTVIDRTMQIYKNLLSNSK